MNEYCHDYVVGMLKNTHTHTHTTYRPTHRFDHGLNEQQACVCSHVCVLLGRPSNTLSPGGSLIYKASNEVQQRRRARTSPRLIVCLFTFRFHPHPHIIWRGWTWVEMISLIHILFQHNKSNWAAHCFPQNFSFLLLIQRPETETERSRMLF